MKKIQFAALLILTGCAHGSHVLTGTAHPAIVSDAVRIYSTMPDHAETIGKVSANQAFGISSQGEQDSAMRELKKQAAKIGANGIVISQADWNYFSGGEASGTAIFIPESVKN